MEEKEIQVIEIDSKKYFLVDTLNGDENTYYYFSNVENNEDVIILKDDLDNFVSLDDDKEFDRALCLFYDKYKDIMNDKNTN